jgi:hypothetical protein
LKTRYIGNWQQKSSVLPQQNQKSKKKREEKKKKKKKRKKMGGRCAAPGCVRAALAKSHWLCTAHRRERGRAFLADVAAATEVTAVTVETEEAVDAVPVEQLFEVTVEAVEDDADADAEADAEAEAVVAEPVEVTEGDVLGALVFSLPAQCSSADHFLGRFYAVTRCWRSRRPCRDVLRQHALLGKVRVARGITRHEMTAFVTRFAAFTMAHASALGWNRLVDVCADRVAKWYTTIVAPGPIRAILHAERLLACLAPRPSPYLVYSDAVRALLAVLPADAIERVFEHYIRLIRRGPLPPMVTFRFMRLENRWRGPEGA